MMNLAPFFQGADRQTLLHEVIRHLPPSGSELRLLDVGSCLGSFPEITGIQAARPDLLLISTSSAEIGHFAGANFDAALAFLNRHHFDAMQILLEEIRRVLRPGGRLLLLFPYHIPHNLERAGYSRILAETLLNGELALNRGERPYDSELNTIERVNVVAENEYQKGLAQGTQLFNIAGRFIYLLIRQIPNKPIWAMTEHDTITWQAISVQNDQQIALAFTALPKAVSFMQAAVLAGVVRDVNKIAKFSKAAAAEWSFPVWLNPTLEQIRSEFRLSNEFIFIDPLTAETPDE